MPGASRSHPQPPRRPLDLIDVSIGPALLLLVGVPALAPGLVDVGLRLRAGLSVAPDDALRAAAPDGAVLVRTLGSAVLIGLVSALLALPGAWVVRGRGWALAPLLVAPALFPPYLAYAGWGLLRAPGTLLGDLLMRAPEGVALSVTGWLGIGALVLWGWPVAAIVIALGDARINSDWIDALRLEPLSRTRLRLEILRMRARSAVVAAGVVALIMLGSAVPLHLARVNTLAITLWSELAQTSESGQWLVWVRAWPLVVIAVACGALVSRAMVRPARVSSLPARARGGHVSRSCMATAGGVWIASVLVPLVLFALDVRSLESVRTFWSVHGEAVWNSLLVASLVAGAGAGMTLVGVVALSSDGPARALGGVVLGGFVVAGLLPGVLVGSATLGGWSRWEAGGWVVESRLLPALGHVARFGAVPLLVAAWIARLEPAEARDLRRLHGVRGLLSRARGGLLSPLLAGAAGGGLLVFALSVHEVQAAVLLAPPGRDTFARRMLEFLHFSRFEPLSIGGLGVVLTGVVAGVGAWAALSLAARWSRGAPIGEPASGGSGTQSDTVA